MKIIKENKIIICVLLILITITGIYISKKTKNKITYDKLDMQTTWNNEESTIISLETNKNVDITKGGTYVIQGTSENTNILVNTEEDVILILNNAEITNKTGPAITIENSNKTIITLNENTENKLSDGNNENKEYDAVIYSKDDLTINGTGTLEITTSFENGIKCTDDLKIMSGNIKINSNTNGIIGKDSIIIKSGNINIKSNGDAIKTNNEEELEKGNITIEDANITIETQEDGIQADQTLTINNGTFKINSNDDGIHSNGELTINDGTLEIKSNDDALHAESILEINNGTLNITAREGIESTYVKINGGNIVIEATDDGINAGKKSNEIPTIEINGGNITINMSSGDTDAIDSNGNLYINGGTINITGNSAFDYDGEGIYKNGTIIVNGKEINELTNQFMGGPAGMQDKNMGEGPNQGMRR